MPRKPWCALLLPAVLISAPAAAQERPGVVGELLRDVTIAEGKVIALAKALPSSAYDWRPAPGVRSTSEVFVHIAGDNYFLPAPTGVTPPPGTGIDAKDFKSVARFEERHRTRVRLPVACESACRWALRHMLLRAGRARSMPPEQCAGIGVRDSNRVENS